MLLGILLIVILFVLWKLFVDGWLFKGILFVFGWFGLYVYLLHAVEGANKTALTINNHSFSWAFVVPTIVCFLCLLFSREES